MVLREFRREGKERVEGIMYMILSTFQAYGVRSVLLGQGSASTQHT